MSSSNYHPATVEDVWEPSDEEAGSSDQLMEKPDKDAESSDQLMEITDEDAESSDQLAESQSNDGESSDQIAETQSDDWESSDQLSETPDEDLESTTAPPNYSSIQLVANNETGSSYEPQENIMQRLLVTDLESGRSEPTKPCRNWIHKFGRMLTLENVLRGTGIVVGGAVGVCVAIILGIVMWNIIIYMLKHRQKIDD